MKQLLVISCFAAALTAIAGEPGVPRGEGRVLRLPAAPRAWLGLDVSKPDESITAHLPALPPGIGFVIRSIEKGGPAELAGLREFDVLWKFGDQMLVNESQLAALLRLAKPEQEVVLAGFRGGKPLEVKLKLGEAPDRSSEVPDDLIDETILPGDCSGPMRVVNISEKVASYSNDEGRLEVRREGQGYLVKIQNPDEKIIFEGEIPADGNFDTVPDGWKRQVHALRRGLDHQLQTRFIPVRQPRPRVVPPDESEP